MANNDADDGTGPGGGRALLAAHDKQAGKSVGILGRAWRGIDVGIRGLDAFVWIGLLIILASIYLGIAIRSSREEARLGVERQAYAAAEQKRAEEQRAAAQARAEAEEKRAAEQRAATEAEKKKAAEQRAAAEAAQKRAAEQRAAVPTRTYSASRAQTDSRGNDIMAFGGSQGATSTQGVPKDLFGTWRGTYTCAQGLTDVTVVLQGAGGIIEGTFSFNFTGRSPARGSFKAGAQYDASSRTLKLWPLHVLDWPAGYTAIGFTATVDQQMRTMAGRIDSSACGAINLQRS